MALLDRQRPDPLRDAARETGSGVAAVTAARRRPWYMTLLRLLLSLALVAAIIAGALSFRRYLVATQPVAPRAPAAERARPVAVATVAPGTIEPVLTLYGQIVAGRSVDLRVLVAGEVVSVAAELVEGGRVAKDAALVAVEPFEYEGALVRARTELAEAEARIVETRARIVAERDARKRALEQEQIAEREVERLSTLQDRGATSSAALDQSKSRMAAAMAAVEARENQVRVLEAQLAREEATLDRLRWNVRKAERDIRNTTLRAPFEGIVSNVAAEAGRLLNVSDRIATLVDLDRFEVRFSLSDAQYGRLVSHGRGLEGRAVTVRWRGGATELEARGTIDRLSPTIASATGGFDVYARLERSPSTELLRPGAFVTVTTPDIRFTDVIRLPQSAIHPGGRIFSVGSDNRLVEIPAEIAGYVGSDALVRAAVPAGSIVMTSRLPDAGPGVLVKPQPER
jgi:RND family efflux transporter MFP subunit